MQNKIALKTNRAANALLVSLLLVHHALNAQTGGINRLDTALSYPAIANVDRFSYHFQTTIIDQHQLKFNALYTGPYSLQTSEPQRMSVTSTLFVGARLSKQTELYLNPELSGGNGLSSTRGIAGFPNGETYRIGDPEPVLSISRLFVRHTLPIKGSNIIVDGGQNIIKGLATTERIVFTLGKFSVTDIFDANSYSHDPRNQFMNWAIMSAGAWDYPANTRGYTWGLVAEWIKPKWSVKLGITTAPEAANGPYMDMNIAKAHSETIEFDQCYTINKKKGVVRLIGYFTQANMGNYADAINTKQVTPDITISRSYAHNKGGFVINAEQEITDDIGVFCRASWNDGKNETWAFTEIDNSLNIGAQIKANSWKRPNDKLGVAILVNGLSDDHRKYLEAGGYGFIIGDGALKYGAENVVEIYYSAKFFDSFWLSPDYQLVINPGYNTDRGPMVHIFGIRGHLEF